MDDLELHQARMEYLIGFFEMSFFDGSRLPSRLLLDMPQALALLVAHNADTKLSHIPLLLTDEATCMRLAANLPAPYRQFWRTFWNMRAGERLALALYCKSRIHAFLSSLALHIEEEG